MAIKKTTRARLNGYIGIAIATLLTPAGKIISTALAAATVVGLLHTGDQPPASKKVRSTPAATLLTAHISALPVSGDRSGIDTVTSVPANTRLVNSTGPQHLLTGHSGVPSLASNSPGGYGQSARARGSDSALPGTGHNPPGQKPEGLIQPKLRPEINPECKPGNAARSGSKKLAAKAASKCKSDKNIMAGNPADQPDGTHAPEKVVNFDNPNAIKDPLPPLTASGDTPPDTAPQAFPVLRDPLSDAEPADFPALDDPDLHQPDADTALPIISAGLMPVNPTDDTLVPGLSSIRIGAIPEPATMSLIALGLLGYGWVSRKKL